MLAHSSMNTDLCIIGGGLAGVCAAIAAAREGISVTIMQERPVFGGNSSSEIRMWICGARGHNNRETGIIEELMLENLYRNPTKNPYLWDALLLDKLLSEKNITILTNCTCVDAETENGDFADGRNIRIKNVTGYRMTTQEMITVSAKYFADCSGDSITAPITGANFRMGREGKNDFGEDTHVENADSFTMGMSCLIQAVETRRAVPFHAPDYAIDISDEEFENRRPNLNKSDENFWYLELGGNHDTIADTEDITKDLLSLSAGFWKKIKEDESFKAENFDISFMGFLPGKRESRRMVGEYTVTERDISSGYVFPDTVAYGGWTLDDHFPGGFFHKGEANTYFDTPSPYTLPYRALYSENVENLFFAGRNISMTHMAMSSIRVMATCALLGQAVGTAASIACRNGLTPHGVYLKKISELQDILLNNDCFLPFFKRKVSPFCKNGGVPEELYNGEDRPNSIYGKEVCGVVLNNGDAIAYCFDKPVSVEKVHIVFDSDLDRLTLPGDECERIHITRSNTLLNSPDTCLPKTLCRDFELSLIMSNGEHKVYNITDNRKRTVVFNVGAELTQLSLKTVSNWGETETTRVFSFDFI